MNTFSCSYVFDVFALSIYGMDVLSYLKPSLLLSIQSDNFRNRQACLPKVLANHSFGIFRNKQLCSDRVHRPSHPKYFPKLLAKSHRIYTPYIFV